MNKTVLVLLIVLICCSSIITIWALPRLLPPTYRAYPINLSNLLISIEVFPPGWQLEGIPEGEPQRSDLDWGKENMVARFQLRGHKGYATHYIFEFKNEASARYGLFWIKRQGFLTPLTINSPDGWTYQSPFADEWIFGCTDEVSCTSLTRYNEFISVFRTSIDPQYMSFADLEVILRAIDGKMNKYLKIDPK